MILLDTNVVVAHLKGDAPAIVTSVGMLGGQ